MQDVILRNLIYIFSASQKKFCSVLLQIANYIYNPSKMWKRMQYAVKLFWYKDFVHWKLKLLNFLMDSFLTCTSGQLLPLGLNCMSFLN